MNNTKQENLRSRDSSEMSTIAKETKEIDSINFLRKEQDKKIGKGFTLGDIGFYVSIFIMDLI